MADGQIKGFKMIGCKHSPKI